MNSRSASVVSQPWLTSVTLVACCNCLGREHVRRWPNCVRWISMRRSSTRVAAPIPLCTTWQYTSRIRITHPASNYLSCGDSLSAYVRHYCRPPENSDTLWRVERDARVGLCGSLTALAHVRRRSVKQGRQFVDNGAAELFGIVDGDCSAIVVGHVVADADCE